MSSEPPFGLELEARVRATPDAVFRYFIDPVLYRRWQGDEAELDARPGGLYRVTMPGQVMVEGTYLVVEPPDRVVFTWGWVGNDAVPPGSTTVEVTLTADGDETVIRLVHRGLPTEASRDEHAVGWHHYVARLAVVARGGDPGPDSLASDSAMDED